MRVSFKSVFVTSMAIAVACAAVSAHATQPGQTVNPNGFPSGAHYNLNLIGKADGFSCPAQEFVTDEFGNLVLDASGNPIPAYGNVVFVPQNGIGIQVLMQSGLGKRAAAVPTLQATDACTAAIDGDAAVVQIPKNDQGYRVYARALAKPSDSAFLKIVPDLVAVEDEFGNDLIYLGLVTSNGFETPYATFTRKGGKSTAVDITGLFEWSGDVCYFSDTYCDPVVPCATKALCCTDANLDGIFEGCLVKEGDLCPIGTVETTAFCRTYVDEWVFNIGDFVTYLWDLENTGVKLLQVRFYPVQ